MIPKVVGDSDFSLQAEGYRASVVGFEVRKTCFDPVQVAKP